MLSFSRCSPVHVIQILNHLFCGMDDRIKKYDVTRVELVGELALKHSMREWGYWGVVEREIQRIFSI